MSGGVRALGVTASCLRLRPAIPKAGNPPKARLPKRRSSALKLRPKSMATLTLVQVKILTQAVRPPVPTLKDVQDATREQENFEVGVENVRGSCGVWGFRC